MRLLTPQTDEQKRGLAEWAAQQLGIVIPEPYIALGIVNRAGVVSGVIILNDYTLHNIEISAAGRGAFTPAVIRQLSRYVFNQLGCERVTLRTKRSNKEARKVLGRHFTFEATLSRFYGKEDAFLFRMRRDECRWLGADKS